MVKLGDVWCVVRRSGCPEEGDPFRSEVRAVAKTRQRAQSEMERLAGGFPLGWSVSLRIALVDGKRCVLLDDQAVMEIK